jgi:hypothetical protein
MLSVPSSIIKDYLIVAKSSAIIPLALCTTSLLWKQRQRGYRDDDIVQLWFQFRDEVRSMQ